MISGLKKYIVWAAVLVTFLLCSTTHAQTEFAQDLPVTYTIQSGDTLSAIAKKYLIGSEAIEGLQQANPGIQPERLKTNEQLLLPRHLLRYTNSTAVVSFIQCKNKVESTNNNKVLELGSILTQDDVIKVPALCEVSLMFEDKSTVRIPSGGTIKITVLRTSVLQKLPEVQLDLLDGRLEAKVTTRKPTDGGFSIKTPNSVAGVRGTEFRVGYDQISGDAQIEVTSGLIATRGTNDQTSEQVAGQYGVVVARSGQAGTVEKLPLATEFITAQTQQQANWTLLVFKTDPLAKNYVLQKSNSPNTTPSEKPSVFNQPNYLAQNLGTRASFLEWTAKSPSGLQGDMRKFGVCTTKTKSQPYRCDVAFDLRDTRDVQLTLFRVEENNALTKVLGQTKTLRQNVQAVVTGLPVGHYRWEMDYAAGGNFKAKKTGQFELIAVNQ